MLFVPYSSTIDTIELRIPVRMDATTMAVITPTTIPRIVRNDLNLCERIESIAIFRTSIGSDVDQRIFATLERGHPAPPVLTLCQRDDRIEPCRLPCRIQTGNNTD